MGQTLEQKVATMARELTALTGRVDREGAVHRAMHQENSERLARIEDKTDERLGRIEDAVQLQTRTSQQIVDMVDKGNARIAAIEHNQTTLRPAMMQASADAAKEGAIGAMQDAAPGLLKTSTERKIAAAWSGVTFGGGGLLYLAGTKLLEHLHWFGF